MIDQRQMYLDKALESLAGAESELIQSRFNNCVNRCYYACFQAAVSALLAAGIAPRSASSQWSHTFVSSQFDGQLINRRKLYSSELRGELVRSFVLRQTADYEPDVVGRHQAERYLRRTRAFVGEVARRRGNLA